MGEWACLKVRVETQLFLSPLQKSGFFGTQEVRWVLGVRVCVCVCVCGLEQRDLEVCGGAGGRTRPIPPS